MYQHAKQVNTLGKLNPEALKPAAATLFNRVHDYSHHFEWEAFELWTLGKTD